MNRIEKDRRSLGELDDKLMWAVQEIDFGKHRDLVLKGGCGAGVFVRIVSVVTDRGIVDVKSEVSKGDDGGIGDGLAGYGTEYVKAGA